MTITYKCIFNKAVIICFSLFLIASVIYPNCLSKNESEKEMLDILWWYDLDAPSFGSAATEDIDDDGLLEIVFGTYFNDEHIYALNAEDGSLLWKYNTNGCNDASPVIYDVDGDDELEVIVPSSSPYTVYCFNGKNGTVEWSTSTGYPNCIDSPPAIADVDNDEKPEIILGTFYGYVFCLNGEDGSIGWQINLGTDSYIQSGPNILDVNNDGQLDIVVVQYAGDCRLYTLYGNNGSTLWYSDIPNDYMYHGASFADIDEDGKPEIVIGCYDNNIYVFNAEDGSLHWDYLTPNAVASPTSIADLNNDEHLEIVFTSYNYLGVLSHTGDLLWSITTGGSIFRGAAITDTDNDGILDVIFGSDDGILRIAQGNNGSLIESIDLEAHYGNTYQIDHAPILADFNDDTYVDICIIGGYGTSSQPENNHGRVYVVEGGSGTGPGWPMFRHDIHHSACFHYNPIPEEHMVYVDDDADQSWYDATHVRTVQEGINNASSNDTVFVYNGIYYEHLIINKSLNLIGENKTNCIINGNETGTIINLISDYVNIINFTFISSGDIGFPDFDAAVNIQANHTKISNSLFSNHTLGIRHYLFPGTTDIEIENNKFQNVSEYAIYLMMVNNCTIKDNTIFDGGDGIKLSSYSNDNIIFYNSLRNLSRYHGILVDTSFRNQVKDNIIISCPNGIELSAPGRPTDYNNIFQNQISNCYAGIVLDYASNNTLFENLLNNNSYGLYSSQFCYNNSIYRNNFINNYEYNARDYGINIWDNGYPSGGNYWDDYTGIDENNGENQNIPGEDGIGDTPYEIIESSNQDNYPFMNMSGWIQLDINQSLFNRGFPIRHTWDGDWGAAQNFTPTLNTLTSAEIYLRKFGSPEFDLIVELRSNHPQGILLDTLSFTPGELASSWQWLELDFVDISVDPDMNLFIVLPPAPSSVSTSFGYEWGYAFGDQYQPGSFWFTRDGGGLWRDLPTRYEFVFRTYGSS